MRPYRKFVLLVDDDPADLFFFKYVLEKADFQVIATTHPDVAMSAIVAGEIGCLVADQKMPVSGHQLISSMQAVRSDIDAILLSGADAGGTLPPDTTFIHKDDRQKLLQTVSGSMFRYRAA